MKRAVLSEVLVWAKDMGCQFSIIGIIPLMRYSLVMVVSILALEWVGGCTCFCNLHPMLKYLEVRCPT